MKPEFYWNDVDGHSGLHIGDKLVATIHQEGDVFYLVAIVGNVRYCYHKLEAKNLEQAKKITVDLLRETYFDEYMRVTHEADDLLAISDELVHISWAMEREAERNKK